MKTAIEWLEQHLKELENKVFNFEVSPFESPVIREDLYKQAKAMEKEQICNAYTDGLEGPYLGAEEYHNRTYNQKGIDAGIFLSDLLTKELEELGDEDLEPREEVQNLGVDPVLRLKEDHDPNTINFRWNDTEEVILKISKEGFYYRGELVEDIHNVYERFNEWLTKIE